MSWCTLSRAMCQCRKNSADRRVRQPSPKASVTLGAYLLRRGGGAAGARGGGGGAWHSVRGSAPSGFAMQAGQGVTAALGVGHDNGGGDALPQYGLNLDAAQFSYSVRCNINQLFTSVRNEIRVYLHMQKSADY